MLRAERSGVLMVFCALGAIFLLGRRVYAELQELWAQSGKHNEAAHASNPPHPDRSIRHDRFNLRPAGVLTRERAPATFESSGIVV